MEIFNPKEGNLQREREKGKGGQICPPYWKWIWRPKLLTDLKKQTHFGKLDPYLLLSMHQKSSRVKVKVTRGQNVKV